LDGKEGKRVAPEQVPGDVDGAFWPGVFETRVGKVAVNSGQVSFGAAVGGVGLERLSSLKLSHGAGVALSPWLALAALACLAGAAAVWEKRRTPRRHPPPHLEVETVKQVQTVLAADGHVHRHETETPPR
jgi:hypothetical protein